MKIRMAALAVTMTSAALYGVGCKEDTAPAANATSQLAPVAIELVAYAGAAPAGAAPAAQQPQAMVHPAAAASAAPLPGRTATKILGAGVRGRIETFYDDLSRHGTWVRHPDFSYVWLPARQGRGWRPYQEGRWIWTDEYGWYWESAEPFAWAVYHYGRWGYDPDFGWFWVPGDTWAPAWVTWRHGHGRVAWAPVGPDRKGYAMGAPRRLQAPVLESWVAVDIHHFGDPNIGQYTLPIREIGAILESVADAAAPQFENGLVTNRAFGRAEVERLAGHQVEVREVVYVGSDDDSFEDVRGGRIGVYRPLIDGTDPQRPPREVAARVGQVDRVTIREFSQRRIAGVPSVALLTVLDERERQTLEDDRLTREQAAVEARIEQLRRERAGLLEQRQQEAARLDAQLEQERQGAIRQRMQEQQRLLDLRRQRSEIVKVVDTPPAQVPVGAQPMPAIASNPANASNAAVSSTPRTDPGAGRAPAPAPAGPTPAAGPAKPAALPAQPPPASGGAPAEPAVGAPPSTVRSMHATQPTEIGAATTKPPQPASPTASATAPTPPVRPHAPAASSISPVPATTPAVAPAPLGRSSQPTPQAIEAEPAPPQHAAPTASAIAPKPPVPPQPPAAHPLGALSSTASAPSTAPASASGRPGAGVTGGGVAPDLGSRAPAAAIKPVVRSAQPSQPAAQAASAPPQNATPTAAATAPKPPIPPRVPSASRPAATAAAGSTAVAAPVAATAPDAAGTARSGQHEHAAPATSSTPPSSPASAASAPQTSAPRNSRASATGRQGVKSAGAGAKEGPRAATSRPASGRASAPSSAAGGEAEASKPNQEKPTPQ